MSLSTCGLSLIFLRLCRKAVRFRGFRASLDGEQPASSHQLLIGDASSDILVDIDDCIS